MDQPKTLITGAASGIGLSVARQLSIAGHELILVDLAPAAPEDLSYTTYLSGDVASERFWDEHKELLNGLSHAVINAGVSGSSPIAELGFAEWRRILSVNLDGAFLTLRAAVRAMPGDGTGRSIVVTASMAGIKAEPGIAAYGASKAAVIHLTRIAAKELAPRGIRVNAIAPGGVDTPIWDEMPFFQQLLQSEGNREAAMIAMARMATPLGRYATPDEIAAQIRFLLSEDAATITGAILASDGGYSL